MQKNIDIFYLKPNGLYLYKVNILFECNGRYHELAWGRTHALESSKHRSADAVELLNVIDNRIIIGKIIKRIVSIELDYLNKKISLNLKMLMIK